MDTHDTPSLDRLFADAREHGVVSFGQPLWGFGGLQGGVSLALLLERMQAFVPDRALRQISGRYRKALRDSVTLEVSTPSVGKSVAWLEARASSSDQIGLDASATFAVVGKRDLGARSPARPPAPPPEDCPIFTIPPEFVPFSRRTEIRPVGDARPYTGAAEPGLMAWIRLLDDDTPPDASRLLVLMDCLPPAFAAVLPSLVPIPTVTFSVSPGADLARVSSPWALVRARTESATRDGWLTERIDAWSPDGLHLGGGEQLRVVMGR